VVYLHGLASSPNSRKTAYFRRLLDAAGIAIDVPGGPNDWGRKRSNNGLRTGTREVFHYADARMRPLGYQLLKEAERYEPAPNFSQPALIFHGKRDDVVPVPFRGSLPPNTLTFVGSRARRP
jgi:pimeloyl-ACP methyl ester carboxylesterase